MGVTFLPERNILLFFGVELIYQGSGIESNDIDDLLTNWDMS